MPPELVKPEPIKHEWSFYLSPAEAWEAMYRDCEQAKESIEFEQYILENDEVGQRFMELFIKKAAEKIKIYILCDKFGSVGFFRSPWVKRLRKSGGEFHFYNPIGWTEIFMPWKWFPRTHTKTLLVDSKIAYAGGVCMAERMTHWRDTQIRFTGPAVAEVREAFDALEARRRFRRNRTLYHYPDRKNRSLVYLQNLPRISRPNIYQELVNAIDGAQNQVCIATAYFAPNKKFFALLRNACVRGVKVTLLVSEHSDVPLADLLCLTYMPELLQAGVRIHQYQGTVMHSKVVIVDNSWATVGSMNIDVISFFYNREANVVTTECDAVIALRQQFENDLKKSVEMTEEKWKMVPAWKIAGGYFARLLKQFF